MHYPPRMAHVQAKPPSMHGNPKVSAYFTCIFHLPMTGEVGSLFLLAWVKKQETSVLAINHNRQATHYLPLTYRRSHRPCMANPPKKFEQKGKKIIDGRPTSLLSPSPSPVLVLLQDVCLRGLDEQQFKRGQHCMEPLPSPEKRLAHGKLSLSLYKTVGR